jgi:uncharacterized protein (DUF1684 family)
MKHMSILIFMLSLVSQFAFANSKQEKEWQTWVESMNDEFKNSEDSILNVTDTVILQKGDTVYLALNNPAGDARWSKSKVSPSISIEMGDDSLILHLENESKIDLRKEKKWKLSNGLLIRPGRFLNGKQKIFIHDQKAKAQVEFKGLDFFSFNPKAVVVGKLIRNKTLTKVELATNTPDTRTFNEIGTVSFVYKGHKGSLKAYSLDDPQNLKALAFFFRDKSNGKTTYGGGRNLEVDVQSQTSNKITLDFNRAFNPYCARSSHFQCVLSKDPVLNFEIDAGEKKVSGH